MKKYIDSDTFIEHCCNTCIKNGVFCRPTIDSCDYIEDLQAFLSDAPVADVAEVVHGEWETDRDTIRCSVCGFGYFPHGYFFKDGQCVGDLIFDRCPNCGAKMDGEKGWQ